MRGFFCLLFCLILATCLPEIVQSDMTHTNQTQSDRERLSYFKVWAGAPFGDEPRTDAQKLNIARTLTVGPPGSGYSRETVPLGVIQPEVANNPDDGIHRNCFARESLHKLAPAQKYELRERLYEIAGGVCSYCDDPIKHLDCDHVWPAEHGGMTSISNMVACCRSCNMAGADARTPTFWMRRAFIRSLKPGLVPDTWVSIAKVFPRVDHLHADLL